MEIILFRLIVVRPFEAGSSAPFASRPLPLQLRPLRVERVTADRTAQETPDSDDKGRFEPKGLNAQAFPPAPRKKSTAPSPASIEIPSTQVSGALEFFAALSESMADEGASTLADQVSHRKRFA